MPDYLDIIELMTQSTRSEGEEAYAGSFTFNSSAIEIDHSELQDFFYKFAHNYNLATEDLQLLKQIYEIEYSIKTELLMKINHMALQSFCLDIRRMTDARSKRSLRKLLPKIMSADEASIEIIKLKSVYEHYKPYIDKGVAHQDEVSIHENLGAFPDIDIIDADMAYLKKLYYRICEKYTRSYL